MNLYKLHKKPKSLLHHDDAYDHVIELAWEKFCENDAELSKRENLWARHHMFAYLYALTLERPFPAGEAAIAKDPAYAYSYAYDVLNARFPAGEAAIAKDPAYAYSYARDVLEGPFPAGEAAIMASEYRVAYLRMLEIE